jgi:hypothetical protein
VSHSRASSGVPPPKLSGQFPLLKGTRMRNRQASQ